jgi:hypothetical protein
MKETIVAYFHSCCNRQLRTINHCVRVREGPCSAQQTLETVHVSVRQLRVCYWEGHGKPKRMYASCKHVPVYTKHIVNEGLYWTCCN